MSSIYVHVPWCRRRCPYCDFYLVVGRPDKSFIEALILEFKKRNYNQEAKTLYFGGGTPSLLKPSDLSLFIDELYSKKALALDSEITIEVNPEDITKEYAQSLSLTPINRISLGIQSFDNNILRFLGRKHDQEMAQKAIFRLKDAGFNNISVDQIIGVPKENPEKILFDLDWLSYLVQHLSYYLLTIENNTNFFKQINKKIIPNVDDDKQADIYELVQKNLYTRDFIQYDISSYAKPGFFSRHNQTYWGQGEYLGLGPGAHSLKFLPDGVLRTHNKSDLKTWLKDPTDDRAYITEILEPKKAFLEALAFGFRNMADGVNPKNLANFYKQEIPKDLGKILEKFKDFGWLEEKDGSFMISHKGALYGDAIIREVLFS
jgi:oxygen-independent coproporphyrinogen-3 oxidase